MSEKVPKWAYVLVGALLIVLIIVSIISLVTSGGFLSKIVATSVIGASVLGLFFGHSDYKKEHTLVGQVKGFGQDMLNLVGIGSKKSWWEGGRRK